MICPVSGVTIFPISSLECSSDYFNKKRSMFWFGEVGDCLDFVLIFGWKTPWKEVTALGWKCSFFWSWL